jgi:hypothetical protein
LTETPRKLQSLFCFLLCALALVSIGASVLRHAILIRAPYELNYGEGIVVYQAMKLDSLKTAYPKLDGFPFIVFHYTPLYHYAMRAVSSFTGGDLFLSGRYISFACGLAILLLAAYLVLYAMRGRQRLPVLTGALVACALFLLTPSMTVWSPNARVDLMGLLLTFAAVCVFVSSRSVLADALTAVLLVGAVYCKQVLISAALSILLVAALRDWRQALRIVGFCLIAGLIPLAVFFQATDGQVLKHWFAYNHNTFSVTRALFMVIESVRPVDLTALLAVWLLAVVFLHLLWRHRDKLLPSIRHELRQSRLIRVSLLSGLILCLSFAFSFTSGKTGSDINYFLEWHLYAAVLAGIAVALALRSPRLIKGSASVVVLAALLALLVHGYGALINLRKDAGLTATSRARIEQGRRAEQDLIATIRRMPGDVVAENMSALIRAGKRIVIEPAITRELISTGVLDEEPYLQLLREHKLGGLILLSPHDPERFTPRFLETLQKHYRVTGTIGKWLIYEPATQTEGSSKL